jgi:hypothetical protein
MAVFGATGKKHLNADPSALRRLPLAPGLRASRAGRDLTNALTNQLPGLQTVRRSLGLARVCARKGMVQNVVQLPMSCNAIRGEDGRHAPRA